MRPTGPTGANWRKSFRCAHGDCIEVASQESGVAVRDSKNNASGPNLVFAPADWRSFVAGIKDGCAPGR
jgi:hypothetical protein